MKFIKNNISKENGTTVIRKSSNSSITNSNSGGGSTTLEAHTLWGQPFDGTSDVSGDMTAVGTITSNGNIQTEGDIIIKQLDSDGQQVENGDLSISVNDTDATFNGKDRYVFDSEIVSPKGTITALSTTNITNSDTIKTKNLEVTGSAHFFELMIDKVKAVGGAVLITGCDGFEVDIVEQVTDGYKLYWQCQDGDGNQRDNMWQVNDQALCQSFNQAKVGDSHNTHNKYYWSLVTEVSDNNNPTEKDGLYYHYIVISTTDYDGTVEPEVNDNIVMLGYRGTDDTKRQSAIYISAYTSLDKGLTAPLIAQYRGINNFDLEAHRTSYFDATSAKFVGNFTVEGVDVKEYINNQISGSESGTPYIDTTTHHWMIWDKDKKTYVDSGIIAEGTSVTISSTSVTYAITTSTKQPSDSEFTYTSIPTNVSKGSYIWTKTVVTYSDGTSTKSYSESLIGSDGTTPVWFSFNTKYSNIVYDTEKTEYTPSFSNAWSWQLIRHYGQSQSVYSNKGIIDNYQGIMIAAFDNGKYQWAFVEDDTFNATMTANGWHNNDSLVSIKLVYYPSINFDTLANNDPQTVQDLANAYGDGSNVQGIELAPTAQCELNFTNKAKDGKGEDAVLYRMETTSEYAIVKSTAILNAYGQYIIYQQVGTTKRQISPSTNDFHLEYSFDGSTWTDMSIQNNMCYFDVNKAYSEITNKNYISIRLVLDTDVLDQKVIPITYSTEASFAIDQDLNKIVSRVTDCETNINTANGNIESVTNRVSNVEQKADGITTTVTSTKYDILGDNILRGQNGEGWSGYVKYDESLSFFYLSDTEWTQSPPILCYSGNVIFSFEKWEYDYIVSVYEFQQTYNINNSYNIDCDFKTYTPCTILASTNTYTQDEINTLYTTYKDKEYTLTIDVVSTISVDDYVAITVTNSTTNVHNHIYGKVSSINDDRTEIRLASITDILLPAKVHSVNNVSTADADTLDEITDEATQNFKFHYSSALNRYWIRWVEESGNNTTKTYILRIKSSNMDGTITKLMVEENVLRPHKYMQESQITQSMIKQTADEIKLSVNETYVKIGDGNITLNGDTNVNGSVTINDDNTGFVINGDNGTTNIMPKSIGTYEEFSNNTVNKQYYGTSLIIPQYSIDDDGSAVFTQTHIQKFEKLKADDVIIIRNVKMTPIFNDTTNTQHNVTVNSITFKIFENSTLKKTVKYTNTNTILALESYTVTTDSSVMVYAIWDYTAPKNMWDSGPYDIGLYFDIFWEADLPLRNCFMLIGYDGLGANFTNGSTVYMGKDGSVFQYKSNNTDYKLGITPNGIEQVNRRNVYVMNKYVDSSTLEEYTVEAPIDTVLCLSQNCMVTFPLTPYEGQEIKVYDKAPTETYINTNGKNLVGTESYGDGSASSRKTLPNRVPRVYTYMNGRWYEEYTG